MNDTSGPTSGTQFASYDHDSHSWKMWPGTGLWGSIEFSETWPKTGCMSDGRAYELPTLAPPITVNVSSSWLPTPRAVDPQASMGSPGAARHVAKGNGSLAEVIGVHLPTPTVGNATGTNERRGGARSDEKLLPGVVLDFLPTPNAADGNGGGRYNSSGHQSTLPGTVRLLPTPKASARGDCESEANRRSPDLIAVSHYFPESTGAITDPLFDVGND